MIPKLIFGIGAGSIFAGTAYVTAITMMPPPDYTVSDEHRIGRFEELAPTYESSTRKQEFYLGIGRMRRKLLKNAEGRVLEVGAGSAGNLGVYPADQVTEVIFTDRAQNMVNVGEKKIVARLGYEPYHYPAVVEKESVDNKKKNGGGGSDDAAGGGGGDSKQFKVRVMDDYGFALKKREEAEAAAAAAAGSSAATTSSTTKAEALSKLSAPLAAVFANPAEGRKEMSRRQIEVAARVPWKDVLAKAESEHDDETIKKIRQMGKEGMEQGLYACANYSAESLPFPDHSFDTVVDTFGLCCYDDPVQALNEMSRVCKPDGKILLIEHGKGTWGKVNSYLDKWAPRHAKMWGCWWNRDIRRMVRMSGARLELREQKHFGTTQMMILEPYRSAFSSSSSSASTS